MPYWLWNEDPVVRNQDRVVRILIYIAEILYPLCDKFLKQHDLILKTHGESGSFTILLLITPQSFLTRCFS